MIMLNSLVLSFVCMCTNKEMVLQIRVPYETSKLYLSNGVVHMHSSVQNAAVMCENCHKSDASLKKEKLTYFSFFLNIG